MNNLTSKARSFQHLPDVSPLSGLSAQRVGETEQFRDRGSSQEQVVRIELAQASAGERKQFVTVLIYPSGVVRTPIGLADSLKGRGGISDYLAPLAVEARINASRPLLYRKNGILVGHTGRTITPEEVADVLAEE